MKPRGQYLQRDKKIVPEARDLRRREERAGQRIFGVSVFFLPADFYHEFQAEYRSSSMDPITDSDSSNTDSSQGESGFGYEDPT
ncbi:hypothetical protein SAY87_006249 [Trapa incisa]|uniref:Uncharacterized protein n=1 Tax=Trapa incisa TaxID=236973 RepID=A0AAN7Q7V5_9MYRT|nr:hypothetical protein SAY87_006249 [Trapa incisa]